MHNNKHQIAVFGLLFGAASWGVIWYPYRIMQEAGVSGIASSFYTYSIAALIGALIFARHWRGLFSLPQSAWWLALAAGWTNLSYVIAIIDGEVMRVMLLFYLSPLWTLILAHFWLKEHTGLKGFLVVVTSLVGACIMFWQPDAWPLPENEAEWLALSSGLGFALTNVITRRSTHLSLRVKSMAVWFGVVAVAGVVLLFQTHPMPNAEVLTLSNWLLMGLISLLLIAATMLVQYGLTQIPVTRAAVIFLFELVVAGIASYFWANEAMSLREWLGGSLIVVAAVVASRMDDKH
ncbi:MAG: EamA family transporter [Betaproteobacteria bacterium HGW-Betaproteobacteria-8]|nr:MAG: EamA family transporter [Betaproteobacteria bacterium HGW-Betaproteobacteria-8]